MGAGTLGWLDIELVDKLNILTTDVLTMIYDVSEAVKMVIVPGNAEKSERDGE